MNPLAQAIPSNRNGIGNIMSLLKLMQGKDPTAVAEMMAQRNPQFRQFMENCRGKSMDQVCQEYGVDPSIVKQFLR